MLSTCVCFISLIVTVAGLQVFDRCGDTPNCPRGSECTYRGCDGKLCLCNDGLLPDLNRTQCVPGIQLSEACTGSSICQGQPFSVCINNVCRCKDGYKQTTSLTEMGRHCLPVAQGNDPAVNFVDYNAACDNRNDRCSFDLKCVDGACACSNGTRLATKTELAASPYSYFFCRPNTFKLGQPVDTSSEECQKLDATSSTSTTTTTTSTSTTRTTTTTTTPTTTSTTTVTTPLTTTTRTTKTSTPSSTPTITSTTSRITTTNVPTTTPTSTTTPTTTSTTTNTPTNTPTSTTTPTPTTTPTTKPTPTTMTTTTSTPTTTATPSPTPTPTTTPIPITTSTTTPIPTTTTTATTAKLKVTTSPSTPTPPSTSTPTQPTLAPSTATQFVSTEEPTASVNTTDFPVSIGDSCAGRICPNNSNCEGDTCGERRCRCQLGYATSPDGESCYKLAALGESCRGHMLCQGPFTECTDDGICDCQNEYERSDTGKWCRLKSGWLVNFPLLGESCSSGFFSSCYMEFEQDCVASRCKCKLGGRQVGDDDRHAMYPDIRQCRNSTYITGEREKALCKNQSKQGFSTDIYDKAKSKIKRMQAVIIGGSVGFLVLIGIIIGLVVLIRWKRRGKRQVIRDTSSMASSERYSFKIPRPFTHYVGAKEYDSQQIAYPNPTFHNDNISVGSRPDILNATADSSTLLDRDQS